MAGTRAHPNNVGAKQHPLYRTWSNMRNRCNCVTTPDYRHYGGRGITVCDRWDDFFLFVEDMGPRPEGATLDRIDNDGNYEPSNCRWATKLEQVLNRRDDWVQPFQRRTSPMRYIWKQASGRYKVCMTLVHGGGQVSLGCFDTLEEAQRVRDETEYEREFHAALGLTTEPH